MIFAAGLGTRLKPITDTIPKAMVPVNGKPLLWHTIEKLKTAGVDEIIINVHHFADQIVDYIRENESLGIRIAFSDESEQLLDTGGGIKKAFSFFDDGKPFLVHNVDILSNLDLNKLLGYHKENEAIATLCVSNRNTSRYLLFDEKNRLKGWINEKTGEVKSPVSHFNPNHYRKLAFNGIHVLEPTVCYYMSDFAEKFSIIDFYLSICNKVNIIGFEPNDFSMIDVGKIDSLQAANDFLLANN